uniref:Solute carrier family 30 member 10 n=1 Tax=Cyprinus carpio TaxID=7962 RepID=A0A8C1P4M5_CYPCA
MGRYSGKTCRLILMLVITVIFFVAEIVAGYMGNSIALVSDSFNMLSDILSLCVGLTAARVSRRAGSGRFTYGMGRAEVVGALANAVFLAALCFSVSMESLKRLAMPQAIDDPPLVLIVGSLGLAVNVLGLLIFQDCSSCLRATRRNDAPLPRDAEEETGLQEKKAGSDGPPLNIRGEILFVHKENNNNYFFQQFVSSVLHYSTIMESEQHCTWLRFDLNINKVSTYICSIRCVHIVPLNARLLMLCVSVSVESVCKLPGVASVHEAHVWELAKGRNVASLHVRVCADLQDPALQTQIQQLFHLAGVHSVTVQLERADGETPCGPPASRDVSEKQQQTSAEHTESTKF